MMGTKDGGPAFPVHHSIDGNWQREPLPEFCGMSLRDWLAGQALSGLLAEPQPEDGEPDLGLGHDYAMNAARAAYRIADAMLKARESSK